MAALDKIGASYKIHDHEPAFTMEDLAKVKLEKSPYVKNLFYFDKKSGGYYMIVAETNTKVDKSKLFVMWDFIKSVGKNMRMA